MPELPKSNGLLVLPHLRVQNANAMSSPLTHGFPSMTAFLGLMWALQRKLADHPDIDLRLNSVGVICHDHEEQVTQGGYIRTFKLTRNPVDRDGSTAAIVEEGRIHLTLTLVFGVTGRALYQEDEPRGGTARLIAELLAQMRIAGGSVLPPARAGRWSQPQLMPIPEDDEDEAAWFRLQRRRWLPGFALVCRDDLLQQRLDSKRATDPTADLLGAWLHASRFNWAPPPDTDADSPAGKVIWKSDRAEGSGWVVPIPVGYATLAGHDPGTVAQARDPSLPFRFVESLYSLGQWVGPHRLQSWQQLQWYGHHDPDSGLYRVHNDFAASIPLD